MGAFPERQAHGPDQDAARWLTPAEELDLMLACLDAGRALDTLSVLPQRSLADFLR